MSNTVQNDSQNFRNLIFAGIQTLLEENSQDSLRMLQNYMGTVRPLFARCNFLPPEQAFIDRLYRALQDRHWAPMDLKERDSHLRNLGERILLARGEL